MRDKMSIAPTIKKQVYTILREQICNGDFADGQWLLENDLAASLSVSRSPIREALRQLVSEGFLVEVPNKGVYVREVTRKEILEIYETRKLLENYAILRSKETLTFDMAVRLKQCAEELEDLYAKKDLMHYMEMDRKLHDLVVSLSDNSIVMNTHDYISSLMQRFKRLLLKDPPRFFDTRDEHQLIVQNILSGNIEEAQRANDEHVTTNKAETLKLLDTAKGVEQAESQVETTPPRRR